MWLGSVLLGTLSIVSMAMYEETQKDQVSWDKDIYLFNQASFHHEFYTLWLKKFIY